MLILTPVRSWSFGIAWTVRIRRHLPPFGASDFADPDERWASCPIGASSRCTRRPRRAQVEVMVMSITLTVLPSRPLQVRNSSTPGVVVSYSHLIEVAIRAWPRTRGSNPSTSWRQDVPMMNIASSHVSAMALSRSFRFARGLQSSSRTSRAACLYLFPALTSEAMVSRRCLVSISVRRPRRMLRSRTCLSERGRGWQRLVASGALSKIIRPRVPFRSRSFPVGMLDFGL